MKRVYIKEKNMGEFVNAAQKQEQVDSSYILPLLQLMMQQQKMKANQEQNKLDRDRTYRQLNKSDKWREEARRWKAEQNKLTRQFRKSESKLDRESRESIQKAAKVASDKANEARIKYRKAKDEEGKKYKKDIEKKRATKTNYMIVGNRQKDKYKEIFKLKAQQEEILNNPDKKNNGNKWRDLQKQIDEASIDFMIETTKLKKYKDKLNKQGLPYEEAGIPEDEWMKTLKMVTGENPFSYKRKQLDKEIKKESSAGGLMNMLYRSPISPLGIGHAINFLTPDYLKKQMGINPSFQASPLETLRGRNIANTPDVTIPLGYKKYNEMLRNYKGNYRTTDSEYIKQQQDVDMKIQQIIKQEDDAKKTMRYLKGF